MRKGACTTPRGFFAITVLFAWILHCISGNASRLSSFFNNMEETGSSVFLRCNRTAAEHADTYKAIHNRRYGSPAKFRLRHKIQTSMQKKEKRQIPASRRPAGIHVFHKEKLYYNCLSAKMSQFSSSNHFRHSSKLLGRITMFAFSPWAKAYIYSMNT